MSSDDTKRAMIPWIGEHNADLIDAHLRAVVGEMRAAEASERRAASEAGEANELGPDVWVLIPTHLGEHFTLDCYTRRRVAEEDGLETERIVRYVDARKLDSARLELAEAKAQISAYEARRP
jgi:hypothetical protein